MEILEVLLDALIDSLKAIWVVVIVYIILSFVEAKISKRVEHNHYLKPIHGASLGLIPQCGFSVVASDLYIKEHISMGTLIAIFISTSDEALPLILSDFSKAIYVLPLLGVKFVVAFITGYLVDLIVKSNQVKEHFMKCKHEDEIHKGCCNHDIDNENEGFWHQHLLHPLIHSLKIFAYILGVNILFSLLVYFVGENNISAFLTGDSKYLTPLLASIVGLIPNCASSVIITKLYLVNSISFGTCVSGLITNAGLGILVLLKDKKMIKKTLIIIGILLLVANLTGYTINLIFGF